MKRIITTLKQQWGKSLLGLAVLGVFTVRMFSGGSPVEISDLKPTVSLLDVGTYQEQNASIQAVGEIEALEDVQVLSTVTAIVDRVPVQLGQEVTRGELLVELDNDQLSAQLSQASASIARMQASVDQRIAGATEEEIAQAAASVEAAQAGLMQAQAQLNQTTQSSASAVSNAQIALELAQSTLNNNTASTGQSLESALEDGLNTARSAISAADSALSVYTDYQYLYFIGSESISEGVARAKAEVVEFLLGRSGAGRWSNAALADLNGGVTAVVAQLQTVSEADQGAVEDALTDVETMLESMDAAYAQLQGAMGTYLAVAASSTDTSTIATTRTTIQSNIASVTNAIQAIDSARLGVDRTSDADALAYQQAVQALEDAQAAQQTSVASAQALVTIQEASLAQAQAAYELITSGPREVDLSGLYAGVSEAQASYSLIAAQLDDYFIRAPFDGVVASVPVTAGELVPAGSRIVSLVNDEGYQVRVFINEQDRALVQVGDSAIIEGQINGEVTNIAPSIDPVTKKVEVVIAITDEDPVLVIGAFAQVELLINNQGEDAVFLLPFRAVKTTSTGASVFIVNDQGVIGAREVTLGRIIGDSVEVTDGLAADWQVVASTRTVRVGEEVTVK